MGYRHDDGARSAIEVKGICVLGADTGCESRSTCEMRETERTIYMAGKRS